jgi:sulfate adenylyltransferase subunit 2
LHRYTLEVQITTSPDSVRASIASSRFGSSSSLTEALAEAGHALSDRQIERILNDALGPALTAFAGIRDGLGHPLNEIVYAAWDRMSRARRLTVFFGELLTLDTKRVLILSDRRGHRLWFGMQHGLGEALSMARGIVGKDFSLVPHAELHQELHGQRVPEGIEVVDYAHNPLSYRTNTPSRQSYSRPGHPHLAQLEAESIRIIREAVAASNNPAMLFSMGKDSTVMWTIAKKAFWPEPPPFPLVFVDTRWEHQELYRFRDYIQTLPGTELISYTNPDAISNDINPFDHGSAHHTEITKTVALKQLLDLRNFDFVFGGARRDEERSRSKERIFSLRDSSHRWDPRSQRPELWNVYNTTLVKNQTMRVFPLSNWTELDVWRYIEQEDIPVASLYYSKVRPFVERDGAIIMVDDSRFRRVENEQIVFEPIRFRTLGCYPLTGGVRSMATTVTDIIRELQESRVSERAGRLIDFDKGASMEQKKKEGYF